MAKSKSSKSEKTERAKLIEQTLNKQRKSEKRRGQAIVGACVLVALAIVAVPLAPVVRDWWDLRQYNDLALDEIGADADVCGEIAEKEGEGVSDHRPTGEQIEYPDAPPAFGPHWNEANIAPAPFDDKFYGGGDERPELESLVHNLEHGYTILWYNETAADDRETMSQIESIAKKFRADDDNLRFKFIAAPWTSDDGDAFPEGQSIAFTHWKAGEGETSLGITQFCTDVSGTALRDFMDEYPYTDSPEPGAM